MNTTPHSQAVSGGAETKPLELLADEGRALKGAEARIARMEGCEPFALSRIEIIDPNFNTGAKRMNPSTRQFDVPVYRTVAQFTFDPRQKDAEYYRKMAHALCQAYNSHSTLTEENILLKERVKALEGELSDAVADFEELKEAMNDHFDDDCEECMHMHGTIVNAVNRARSILQPQEGE